MGSAACYAFQSAGNTLPFLPTRWYSMILCALLSVMRNCVCWQNPIGNSAPESIFTSRKGFCAGVALVRFFFPYIIYVLWCFHCHLWSGCCCFLLWQIISECVSWISRIIQINLFTLPLFLVHLPHMLSSRPNLCWCISILWPFIGLSALNPILFLLHIFPAANPSVTSLVKRIAQKYLDLPGKC